MRLAKGAGFRRVSVVIPTRDRAPLLAQALASVAGQTRQPDEIIVVDDASRDETGAVARLCPLATLRYVRLEEPGGKSAARNRGAEAAQGDYVCFLDDDDLWHPRKLELQLARACRTGADFLYHDMDGLRADGSLAPHWVSRSRGWVFLHLRRFYEAPVVTSTVMIRRELLRLAGGFRDAMTIAEDIDLWLRVGELGARSGYLPQSLAVKRLRSPRSVPIVSNELLDMACFSRKWSWLLEGMSR